MEDYYYKLNVYQIILSDKKKKGALEQVSFYKLFENEDLKNITDNDLEFDKDHITNFSKYFTLLVNSQNSKILKKIKSNRIVSTIDKTSSYYDESQCNCAEDGFFGFLFGGIKTMKDSLVEETESGDVVSKLIKDGNKIVKPFFYYMKIDDLSNNIAYLYLLTHSQSINIDSVVKEYLKEVFSSQNIKSTFVNYIDEVTKEKILKNGVINEITLVNKEYDNLSNLIEIPGRFNVKLSFKSLEKNHSIKDILNNFNPKNLLNILSQNGINLKKSTDIHVKYRDDFSMSDKTLIIDKDLQPKHIYNYTKDLIENNEDFISVDKVKKIIEEISCLINSEVNEEMEA